MYINMTPDKTNKTLHASQDDTIRQFKFKLVNDSQVLDVSGAATPIKFDVEPNEVEQLLPVNSSAPTTTPIIADIKYPDELREDQEFVERVTPSTITGKAAINKIKGNALVWNQLIQNGNFENTNNWATPAQVTFTVSNNVGNITTNTNGDYFISQNISMIIGHKYLYFAECMSDDLTNNYPQLLIFFGSASDTASNQLSSANKWTKFSGIFTCSSNQYNFIRLRNRYTGVNNKFKNVMIIDLTLMFGSGNEPTSVSDFTNLFPLPYYDYNAGSLLSFNGTGINVKSPNMLNLADINKINAGGTIADFNGSYTFNGMTISVDADKGEMYLKGTPTSSWFVLQFEHIVDLIYGQTYTGSITLSGTRGGNIYCRYQSRSANDTMLIALGGVFVDSSHSDTFRSLTSSLSDSDVAKSTINFEGLTTGVYYDLTIKLQVQIGNTYTDFKPYYVKSYSLSTSTYFPTGMKSAGTVYDEYTPYKVTTRIGVVDMGTLTYIRELFSGSQYRFKTQSINDKVKLSSVRNPNLLCPLFIGKTDNSNGSMFIGGDGVFFYNNSYTSASDFKTAMSGVYLFYELATPTEQNFESYSLVSEDVEIPLEYDNGFLVCDSDGLTSKAGFIPCKIKMAKEDETLYSQLINLHVERKP